MTFVIVLVVLSDLSCGFICYEYIYIGVEASVSESGDELVMIKNPQIVVESQDNDKMQVRLKNYIHK